MLVICIGQAKARKRHKVSRMGEKSVAGFAFHSFCGWTDARV